MEKKICNICTYFCNEYKNFSSATTEDTKRFYYMRLGCLCRIIQMLIDDCKHCFDIDKEIQFCKEAAEKYLATYKN